MVLVSEINDSKKIGYLLPSTEKNIKAFEKQFERLLKIRDDNS